MMKLKLTIHLVYSVYATLLIFYVEIFTTQFFQQLSQLTCGVAATVTNSRVRPSAPRRVGHRLNATSQLYSRRYENLQKRERLQKRESNNVPVSGSSSSSVADSFGLAAQAKLALGPILASQLSKVISAAEGLVPKGKEQELQCVVSDFAHKIIEGAAATFKKSSNVSPEILDRVWKDVLQV